MKKVITYGSFDLFHEGHYRLLERAKTLGDYLIVGVTTEQYDESRGKLNVVDSLMERIENVRKTGFADEIIVEDHAGQKLEDILRYHVDIFTVGSDWAGSFDYLNDYCEVVYLERTKDISSTMLRRKNYPIVRLGIVGTGRIARRFVPEVKYVSGIYVEGAFNPHPESAEKFAKRFELKFSTDDLKTLFDNTDAVYIAAPHETHFSYAKAALLANKHVLCEKPLCLKQQEAAELHDIAKERKLVLMEAIKTAYCPGFVQLLSLAKSGIIGNIRDVEACFTRLTSPALREMTDTKTGGSFTELGSYTLLAIVKLLGISYQDVHFESFLADNGVDIYTKAYFKYDKSLAVSKTGLGVKSEGELIIAGTTGYIKVAAPWWKTQAFEVCYEDFNQNEKHFVKYLGEGIRYEISDFVSLMNGNEKRDYKLTASESVAMAGIMEKYLNERKKMRADTKKA